MADDQTTRKPGFFSRLFTAKHVESPPEPEAVPEEVQVPAELEEDERGVFARLFSKKTKPKEEEAPLRAEPAAPSWFRRLTDRLGQTRKSLFDNVRSALGLSGKLDDETIEEIEAILLQGDVSAATAEKIMRRMKAEAKAREKELGADGLLDVFKESVRDILRNSAPGFTPKPSEGEPYVVMVVGVNGAGKTTTIAKMAKRCTDAGLKTMLVAGDTFRAAAVEQLEIWAQRTGCDFMRAPHEADAASLCFDAMQRARARGMDVVFVDTAGRLHTKSSLMAELTKIERVIDKQIPGAPHEVLLVLDATTGQNAIQQVRIFSQSVQVTGLIMTKLDGTAKGGVLLSVLDLFKIPITLIGVGEGVRDLRDFDPDQFARALFGEKEPAKG